MNQIRQVLTWVWARQQQITFVATLVMVLLGLVGIGSVIYAAQAVRLQYRQYQEESFNREQGAISLAWHTIAEANLNPSEIGQSNAFRFLVLKAQIAGNLTLNRSSLYMTQLGIKEPLYIKLSDSSICGSDVYLQVSLELGVNLAHTLLIGTRLAGWLMHANFTGADLHQATLYEVRAPSAKFIASNLTDVLFHGGTFQDADFQGANLSGVLTLPGHTGAGSTYNDREYGVGHLYTYEPDQLPAWFASPPDTAAELEAYDPHAVALVDFRGARFLKADIRFADLANSTISQAQVDEACADHTTTLPAGVAVKKVCVEEPWVADQRKSFQRKTYDGRSKALELCQAAASQPNRR